MQPNEVIIDSPARIVNFAADLADLVPPNVLVGDKKVVEQENWYLIVRRDMIAENDFLTIPCPRRIMGLFIGKGGTNIGRIVHNLAQKGLQLRGIQFVEDSNNADKT